MTNAPHTLAVDCHCSRHSCGRPDCRSPSLFSSAPCCPSPSMIMLADLPYLLSFPGSSVGKESTCNAGDLGVIPGLGRSPRERNGYPLQYSGLEDSMDCIAHGVARSWIRLSDFRFRFSPSLLEDKFLRLPNHPLPSTPQKA